MYFDSFYLVSKTKHKACARGALCIRRYTFPLWGHAWTAPKECLWERERESRSGQSVLCGPTSSIENEDTVCPVSWKYRSYTFWNRTWITHCCSTHRYPSFLILWFCLIISKGTVSTCYSVIGMPMSWPVLSVGLFSLATQWILHTFSVSISCRFTALNSLLPPSCQRFYIFCYLQQPFCRVDFKSPSFWQFAVVLPPFLCSYSI